MKLGRALSFCRRVRNRFSPPAFILAYHRIADVVTDPHMLTVTPVNFAQQLSVLKNTAAIIPIHRLVSDLSNGKVPRRTAVITFDDGYLDNLEEAKPLLEQFDAPATVYVATSFCDGKSYWWEELTDLVLYPGVLPQHIRLGVDGHVFSWSSAESDEYRPAYFDANRRWNFTQIQNPSSRHKLFRELCELLSSLPHPAREAIMSQLRSLHRRTEKRYDNSTRSLLPPELTEMASDGLITIAAHTVNHIKLPLIPSDSVESELVESKRWLEELLGRPVNHFAYPHGAYSADAIEAVKAAGFKSAVTCEERVIGQNDNLFALPRFTVRDWSGEEFEQRLRSWLN